MILSLREFEIDLIRYNNYAQLVDTNCIKRNEFDLNVLNMNI